MPAARRAGLLLASVLVAFGLAAAPAGAVGAGNGASRQLSPDVAAAAPSSACRASSGAVGYVLPDERAIGGSFQRY
jgi:hypothetical protein